MISRLQGILLELSSSEVVLDVVGVGYELQCPLSTLMVLPAQGTEVTLHTHLVVREDAHLLFGFATRAERTLFRTLIKTSGVGPKLALAILGGMETEQFLQSVYAQDSAALVKIPGVGKKTADRLMVEMKDKLKELGNESVDTALISRKPDATEPGAVDKQDAESALLALGYKPGQASKAVAQVALPEMSSQQILRAALKVI